MFLFFFFQAEDGIRDLVRSRGLGDVYKRQLLYKPMALYLLVDGGLGICGMIQLMSACGERVWICLLYTSDAADERSSVDLGGRRIIKKKNNYVHR